MGPMTLGRATYDPGWRWSEHVGASTGQSLCPVEHVGLVISGRAAVLMADGAEREWAGRLLPRPARPRQLGGGDEPYVSLHVMGSEDYASVVELAFRRRPA